MPIHFKGFLSWRVYYPFMALVFMFIYPFQAPLCNVEEMKFTRRGLPFVLDFLPKVGFVIGQQLVSKLKPVSAAFFLAYFPHHGR